MNKILIVLLSACLTASAQTVTNYAPGTVTPGSTVTTTNKAGVVTSVITPPVTNPPVAISVTTTVAPVTVPLAGVATGNTSTNEQPPTPETFFTQTETWFTSFNTNYTTYRSNEFQAWTGVAYQSGINLGIIMGLEVTPFSHGASSGLTLGSVSTLSSAVGTIASQEGDIGWSFVKWDTRLTLGGAVTETFQSTSVAQKGVGGGLYMQVEKALSNATFTGLRVKENIGPGNSASRPWFGVIAGFTF